MISAIIPVRNESIDLLTLTISNLTEGISPDDLEVVICNDGSIYPDGTHQRLEKDLSFLKEGRNLKIIDRDNQFGVGYSFDRGVESAVGDTIVLMGCDTIPEPKKWFSDVLSAVKDDELGCACSVGLQPGNYDINGEGLYHRYGAKLMYTISWDQLPPKSELRKDLNYKDILEGRFQPKVSDNPYEISCLMGAFYWIKKKTYERIHGWDTVKGNHFQGHAYWGCLEPYLSLKAKVYGVKVMMYPDIRAGHYFGRIDDVYKARAVREDFKYWNKLFLAHTMLEASLRDEIISYPNHSLCFSQAQVWIKQNKETVKRIRERNLLEGTLISK